ncbi:MAG TPA: hypothetical protein VK631_18340, partial [Solirubrobacteraceae bacterium]|nr:hypothetical protein [Solirubrobacteraceae bacterium]
MVSLEGPERELVQVVEQAYQRAEPEHKTFRDKADEFYRLYRGFTDFRDQVAKGHYRDRDAAQREAQAEWDAELFIPFCYSTVETIVPRMVAKGPRMIVVPRDEAALGNVRHMKIVVDAQQKQINYETVLQIIGKDGLIYGLGVGKTRWKTEKRFRAQAELEPITGRYVEGVAKEYVCFDDAIAERVDPYDFMWDPLGDSMETVEFVIHRLWRSSATIVRNVEAGIWRAQENDPECPWTLEDLLSSRAKTQRSNVWDERLTAEGYNARAGRQDALHEIWEYHDGARVVTVLDGAYPVQHGPNPSGESTFPFQIYRPTVVGGRFAGISEVEPIRHLQYEINTLRSQRRDAATLSLMRTFAFNETAVDAEDLVFGPNTAIPVNGDPREFLFPIPVPELPASSYREEQAIVDDIQRTSGISDPVSGGDAGASETATGVQLVQAAATMRIQNKTRLLETSIIVPQGYEFVALNQRRILTSRTYSIPQEPDPNKPHVPAWQMIEVGPKELMGRMAIEVEGGSTGPENVPQQRADAQT